MYGAGGGGFGDGDLLSILEDESKRPSIGAIIHMCLYLGIDRIDRRTINNDDAWDYFYELLSKIASAMPREEVHDFLGSYLFPGEVEEHLNDIKQLKRKTA